MRRITTIGLCFIAVLSVGGLAASPSYAGKLTQCAFTPAGENTEAFCERTITSGVRIESPSSYCTAGPLLFKNDETYLLTAGHCDGNPWASQEPGLETLPHQIGTLENTVDDDTEGDFGEIKIIEAEAEKTAWAEPFGAPDYDPVWPDMAEWGQETGNAPKSTFVAGDRKPKEGEEVCVEGFYSGEHCGKIITTKKSLSPCGKAYVEVKFNKGATIEGDSGAPWFHRDGGKVFIEGVHSGLCGANAIFTPLDLILKNGKYTKQKLLTTGNEKRKK